MYDILKEKFNHRNKDNAGTKPANYRHKDTIFINCFCFYKLIPMQQCTIETRSWGYKSKCGGDNDNQVLPLINEMENHFSLSETAKLTGKLNILSIPFIRDTMLKKSISMFYKYYPNVQLSIFNGDEDVAIPSLLNNEIDLAFFSIITIDNTCLTEIPKELEFIPFTKFRFNALFNKKSSLSKLSTITLAQLLAYPVILMPTTQLQNYNPYKILSRLGSVHIRLAASYDLYDQFLMDDLGVSIIPDMSILDKGKQSSSTIIQKPISDNVYGTLGYVYNKNNDNPYVKQFLNIFNKN